MKIPERRKAERGEKTDSAPRVYLRSSSWYKSDGWSRGDSSGEWGVLNISACQEMSVTQETTGKTGTF